MSDTLLRERREIEEEMDYRPVSGLAVAGLLMGVAAVAAFAGPPLWSIAFVAVAVNLAALFHVAHSSPPRVGRKAAVAGLALSLFCGAGAVTYHVSYARLVEEQARSVAQAFLDSLLSDGYAAHQLLLEPDQRQTSPQPLAEVYQNTPRLQKELDEFIDASPPAQRLFNLDKDVKAQAVFQRLDVHNYSRYRETVSHLFEIRHLQGGEEKAIGVAVHLTRAKKDQGQIAAWRVENVEERE